jgi:hypothetical protein
MQYIQLSETPWNIQANGAYNNKHNSITTTSVATTISNTQHADAAGGKRREKS